ncbi:hypothetical protein ES705_24369 [subsurface metagenome]
MPAAFMGLLRLAVPFMATIFGGYFISDVFNERMRAKQAQQKADYPAIIQRTLKSKAAFWKFLAVAGLIFGVVVAFLTKRLK